MTRGGVLVVDKPSGPTSFEVVQRVRRLLRAEKAGHAGTLDPLATGLLAVCIDDAVKLQQFLSDCDKTYEALAAFGAATDTEDAEGKVVARGEVAGLTRETIAAALPRFVGEIEQVPPMYSAVRIGGRRLHEAARAGEDVDRAPRRVRVHALALGATESLPGGLLGARIEVRCGKGTYVRTLVADLGRAVGVPAHLAALRRTAAGALTIAQAIPLGDAERLGHADRDALRARLVPPERALGHLPAVRLSEAQARDVAHGRALVFAAPSQGLCQALDEGGRLVAICAADRDALRPVRVFAGSAGSGGPPRARARDER